MFKTAKPSKDVDMLLGGLVIGAFFALGVAAGMFMAVATILLFMTVA